MTTLLIIAVILCLIAAALFTWQTLKARKAIYKCSVKAQEFELREHDLQKRINALDKWQADVKAQAIRQKEWDEKRKHIYANFEVIDADENKPSKKSIGKSLSSKIGYALRHEFPDISEHHDDKKGGRTVYSVDFYVTPCDL